MKTSTKLLLSGAVIISLSLIVFGDAVLKIRIRVPVPGRWQSHRIALFGVAVGFLGVCVFIIGLISIFFEKACFQKKTVL